MIFSICVESKNSPRIATWFAKQHGCHSQEGHLAPPSITLAKHKRERPLLRSGTGSGCFPFRQLVETLSVPEGCTLNKEKPWRRAMKCRGRIVENDIAPVCHLVEKNTQSQQQRQRQREPHPQTLQGINMLPSMEC